MLLIFLSCLSSVDARANGKKPVPKPLTMEEKIKASDLIFVGETIRVFFTDSEGNELKQDPENPLYSSTLMRVRVKKILHSKESQVDDEMTIYYPTGGSLGPFLRDRYVGKDWIFFIRFERVLTRVKGEVIRTNTPMFPRGRWLVYPHAMSELAEVMKVADEIRSIQIGDPIAK